jgi:hypothetical protein
MDLTEKHCVPCEGGTRVHLKSGPMEFARNFRARSVISRRGMCRPPEEGITPRSRK